MGAKQVRIRTVGDALRDARLSAVDPELRTVEGLGARLGVSSTHLCYIEADARMPTEALLHAAAEALGLEASYLLGMCGHIDRQLARWAKATPGVPQLLRRIRDTGADPFALLDKVA